MSSTDFVRRCYARAFGYVRADAGVFVLAVAATALPQILADALLDQSDAARISMLLGLVQLYVNLLVTFRALDHAGAAPPGYQRADLTEARYPSAFVLSLLSTLAIVFGLTLLIVPGALLFLLWSLALPALAAERARSVESLRISWRLARPALGRLALTIAPFGMAIVVIALSIAFSEAGMERSTIFGSIMPNAVASAALPFTASVWTFAYLSLRAASAES